MLENVANTQPQIAELLSSQIAGGDLPGSMLFSGPPFSGKMHCAYQLAQALGSVKAGSLAVSSNRDFQSQVLFGINSFKKVPTIFSRDFLKENLGLFLCQFHNALSTDEIDQKIYDNASEVTELLNTINLVPEDELESFCDKLQTAFLNTIKSLGRRTGLISVAQVRALQSWAGLTSISNARKVVIIEGIEDAGESSRNSLLKILEEPPEDMYFILLTRFPERVMSTILSRTRKYQFFPISPEAKKRLLHSLSQVDSDPSGSLGEYFESTQDNKDFVSQAREFLDNQDLNVSKLVGNVDPQAFMRILTRLIEDDFKASKISMTEAKKMVSDISQTAARSAVFNQNPRLTLEGLFYRLHSGKRV